MCPAFVALRKERLTAQIIGGRTHSGRIPWRIFVRLPFLELPVWLSARANSPKMHAVSDAAQVIRDARALPADVAAGAIFCSSAPADSTVCWHFWFGGIGKSFSGLGSNARPPGKRERPDLSCHQCSFEDTYFDVAPLQFFSSITGSEKTEMGVSGDESDQLCLDHEVMQQPQDLLWRFIKIWRLLHILHQLPDWKAGSKPKDTRKTEPGFEFDN